jgi:tRNA dimethylallyltransferase
MSSMPAVVAVVGPTASGKSALALALAQALDGEIVNADAFACYIGMDIGTAKPSAEEQALVPHHLVDVWQVEHDITVAEYQERARSTVDEIRARGRVPIVAGGSGLYVRSLLEPMEFPGTDPDVRAQLEADLDEVGTFAMHSRLAALDSKAAAAIMPTNARRVVRALEVVTITGRPYTASLPGTAAVYPDVRIGLDVPRPVLDAHIDARVDRMFDTGFVAEVAALEPRLRQARTASRAVGYGELLAHLAGDLSLEEARLTTASATRRLARKQLSWFRRDSSIVWMDGAAPDLLERARSVVAPRLGL